MVFLVFLRLLYEALAILELRVLGVLGGSLTLSKHVLTTALPEQ